MKKIKIAIVFGGKSGEHEVSLLSAKSIVDFLDKKKYEIFLIGIDKKGEWYLMDKNNYLINDQDPKKISLNLGSAKKIIVRKKDDQPAIIDFDNGYVFEKIDIFFPIVHGTYGEDGSLQGFFEMIDACYVGSGVLGSALGMDKDVQKRLLNQAGIKTARFKILRKFELEKINLEKFLEGFDFPVFVKPACLGSSVGVSKVYDFFSFKKAIKKAFIYDSKIMIEQYIKGREIECSVLGNNDPIVSLPGEIIPHYDFYSYEAKYLDENGAELVVPAKLSENLVKKIQEIAIKVFKTLECWGFARVDFFLTENNEIYVNEINTLPGFTKISMFPKLFEISGIRYTDLLDKIIKLAIEKKKEKDKLKRTYD